MEIEDIKKIFGKFIAGEYGLIESSHIEIRCLGRGPCRVILENFTTDDNKDDFFVAINNLLKLETIATVAVSKALYEYYNDNKPDGFNDELEISLDDIWDHINIGEEIIVSRREPLDKDIYLSISSSCEWEEEHGLQIVIKNGQCVNKIGPYDGHLTYADSYDYIEFKNVLYVSMKMNNDLIQNLDYMNRFNKGTNG